jgi:hypothetical protein
MHISEGLCGLDLQTGTWNAVDLPPETLTAPQIDFRTGGNASPFEGEGWGRPERGGTWEIGSYSNLRLKLPSSPKAHYMMTLTAHAFAPKERPAFDVEVHANSVKVAVWHITKSDRLVEQAEIPLSTIRSGTVEIEFLNGDPRSPAEFGLSTDDRKLGLAFETLSLTPATGRK